MRFPCFIVIHLIIDGPSLATLTDVQPSCLSIHAQKNEEREAAARPDQIGRWILDKLRGLTTA